MPNNIDRKKNAFNSFIVKKDEKTYLNLYICHLNVGLIFAYIYILATSASSITTRIIFHNYNFKFNFTLFFLEQLICNIIFESFKKNIKINFQNFLEHKFFYFLFSTIYILNVLSVFYGHQLVINVSMYFSLKKLTPLLLFFIDFFVGKKKLSIVTIISIFLLVGGSILVAKNSFTKDYLGYGIVLISNILTIAYSKMTEVYKKVTGSTNLKLLIYNNYLTLPILFSGIFITGEYIKLYNYFHTEVSRSKDRFIGLVFYLALYGVLCSALTLSFFISNEKNSSLVTKLLSNSRAIFVTILLHIIDKNKNKLNGTIFFGLFLAIIGSFLINIESIINNINTHKGEINDNDNNNRKKNDEDMKINN